MPSEKTGKWSKTGIQGKSSVLRLFIGGYITCTSTGTMYSLRRRPGSRRLPRRCRSHAVRAWFVMGPVRGRKSILRMAGLDFDTLLVGRDMPFHLESSSRVRELTEGLPPA